MYVSHKVRTPISHRYERLYKKDKDEVALQKKVPDKKVNKPISHHSESNQGQFDICDFHYSRMLYQLSYGESPR